MNNVLAFAVYATYTALLLWAAAALTRRINRHYNRRGQR